MIPALSAELLKLRKRPLVCALLGATIVGLLMFRYGFPYLSYLDMEAGVVGGSATRALARLLPDEAIARFAGAVALEASVVGLVIGAYAAGSEHEYGTLKTTHGQQASRWRVVLGQMTALALIGGTLVAALLALSLTAAVGVAAASDSPVALPGAAETATALGAGWLIVVMWSACGVVLATLSRSVQLAVGLGLVWMLGVERTIDELRLQFQVLEALHAWLPGANAHGIATELGHSPAVADELMGPPLEGGHLPWVLASYLLAFLLAAVAVHQRRDVA